MSHSIYIYISTHPSAATYVEGHNMCFRRRTRSPPILNMLPLLYAREIIFVAVVQKPFDNIEDTSLPDSVASNPNPNPSQFTV